MDPFPFAYQKKRSVDDAILYVLNNIYSHLDKPESSIRLMFDDFSSAFNTIKRDKEVLDKIIRKARGVMGWTHLDTLYDGRVTNKLNDILHDITHPLRQQLEID